MSLVHIIILSFIQGATEFLPVSSSGHLVLLPYFFGWHNQGLEMDIALHVGTLSAVVLYFWKDIWQMFTHFLYYCVKGFQTHDYNDHVRLALSLIVATLPAVMIGFTLKKMGLLGNVRQVKVIATMGIIFALVLFITDQFGLKKRNLSNMTLGGAFLIGLGQAIALIPGVSRSGICMSAGLSLGFTRIAAAHFAFLMSIPSILGAAILTTYDVIKAGDPIPWSDISLGILFSTLVGFAAIHFMLRFLIRHSLNIFVIYRILLGLAIWIIT